MTPGGMTPGGMTPGLGLDGGMTPAGLGHGGLTPAGLHHGGMTPGYYVFIFYGMARHGFNEKGTFTKDVHEQIQQYLLVD
jgi:hypothetical protein